jgi:SNF2 family DNA or RNA helicase
MSFSKADDQGRKHVILWVQGKAAADAADMLEVILGPSVQKVSKPDRKNKAVKFYLNKKYLEQMLLAFPTAQLSPGLQRYVDRKILQDVDLHLDEPPFDIPGLYDRKKDQPADLFGYQYGAVREMVRWLQGEDLTPEEMLDALAFFQHDEPGSGKTLMALSTVALVKPRTTLIVAPKNGKYVWEREGARWLGWDNKFAVIDADKQNPASRTALIKRRMPFTVVNPESLRAMVNGGNLHAQYPELFTHTYDLVIIDEFHRFGSPDSQQSVGMLNLRARSWLPMSGTPYLNHPQQLWPILHRIYPEHFPNYNSFVRALQVRSTNGSGKVIGYHPSMTRHLRDFMQPRAIRRRKDQFMKDLPEEMQVVIPVELTKEQRRIYNKIRDEFKMELEGGQDMPVFDQRVQVTRLKQACFSPELFDGSKHSIKIDQLVANVEDLVESGHKILIGSQWAKATRILERVFKDKFGYAYVDGTTKAEERMRQADMFNDDPDCVLYIGTIHANKEVISLPAASEVIFTDKDWSPLVNSQFAARSSVGGLRGLDSPLSHVSVVTMVGSDTYEERVEEQNVFKQGGFNALIESDGGRRLTRREVSSLLELI